MKIYASNNARANPLWRMMLDRVPICTVLWAGTMTVNVFGKSSLGFRILMWLPFWGTKSNPLASKIARTSAPESDLKAGTKLPAPTESRARLATDAAQSLPELHLRGTVRAPPANLLAPHLRLCPAKQCPIRDKVPNNRTHRRARCRVESKGKAHGRFGGHPRTRGEHVKPVGEPRFISACAENARGNFTINMERTQKNHDKFRLTTHASLPKFLVGEKSGQLANHLNHENHESCASDAQRSTPRSF